MLALLLTRKNAKIYALVDGKQRLIGKVKVHDENTMIDVNKYLNGDTYNKHIKIVLNKEISNKLDGKDSAVFSRVDVFLRKECAGGT